MNLVTLQQTLTLGVWSDLIAADRVAAEEKGELGSAEQHSLLKH